VQILVGLVLVSVIYYALAFYATLARKLIGGLIRMGERKQPGQRL
jgi:hypothetical protein